MISEIAGLGIEYYVVGVFFASLVFYWWMS